MSEPITVYWTTNVIASNAYKNQDEQGWKPSELGQLGLRLSVGVINRRIKTE